MSTLVIGNDRNRVLYNSVALGLVSFEVRMAADMIKEGVDPAETSAFLEGIADRLLKLADHLYILEDARIDLPAN